MNDDLYTEPWMMELLVVMTLTLILYPRTEPGYENLPLPRLYKCCKAYGVLFY